MAGVKIRLEAYDDAHRKLLLDGPFGARVKDLIGKDIEFSEWEILTHAMFTEQRDEAEFRTLKELEQRARTREAKFRDYVQMSTSAFHAKGAVDAARGEIERLGVACGVLVVNRVLDVTEADWVRVPLIPGEKTLDLELERSATDGKHIVQVEAKGTIAEDPSRKSDGSTSSMKGDIQKKKAAYRGRHPIAPHVELGVITAVASQPAIAGRIYLLDPPADGDDEIDLGKIRLVGRMDYYLRHLALVGRFQMLIALANRVGVLARVVDYSSLDGVALVNASGEPFRPPATGERSGRVEVGDIIGRLLWPRRMDRLKSGDEVAVPFVGFDRAAFTTIGNQRHAAVLAYKWTGSKEQTQVQEFVLPVDEKTWGSGPLELGVNAAGIAYGRWRAKRSSRQRWNWRPQG